MFFMMKETLQLKFNQESTIRKYCQNFKKYKRKQLKLDFDSLPIILVDPQIRYRQG